MVFQQASRFHIANMLAAGGKALDVKRMQMKLQALAERDGNVKYAQEMARAPWPKVRQEPCPAGVPCAACDESGARRE